LEELGRVDPALGELRHVIMNHDNRACAAVYQDPESGEQRFVFNGRVVARHQEHACESFALSPNGLMLAVTKGRRCKGEPGEIYVNGELAFTVPFDIIYHLVWLDNQRLAWECWNDTNRQKQHDKIKWRQELAEAQGVAVADLPPDPELEDSGVRYFINGEDRTADFAFECYWGEFGRHAMAVWEKDWVYYQDDTGARSRFEKPVLMEDGQFSFSHHRDNCPRGQRRWAEVLNASRGEKPEPLPPDADASGLTLRQLVDRGLLADDSANGRIVWRGQPGPQFDGVENGGGFRTYAFSADKSRIAYVGIRYGGWAKGLMRAVGPLIEKGLNRESGKEPPWWMWPLTLLFNPYMGPGYAATEASRRWYPVDNGQPWKKGYEFANNHFYTPASELVVTCRQGSKVMVVVDEQEGPAFDEVYNVRYLPEEQAICYLARQGDKIFRVTVR
jgi:hypothetical protein